MKNILIIGLGSIGQRHFRNLKKIKDNYKFFAIRKKKNSPELDVNNKVINRKFISSKKNINEISEKIAKKKKFYCVFICNPSSLHIKTALKFIKNCKNLFIEKPLSNNIRNVKELSKKIVNNKIQCAVGYQLRYHPNLEIIRKLIKSEKFGKTLKATIRNGHYLPYHHRYEDYTKGYAANKKLGGGVILCFIHEIDYANYLFDIPLKVSCNGGKKSKLKIDVEDHANMIIDYKSQGHYFKVNINIDFIEKSEKRFCKIYFEKGIVNWDLKKNTLTIKSKEKKINISQSSKIHKNDLFFRQIKNVMNDFKNKKKPKSNLENGISSLKVALAAKKSLEKKKPVTIGNF